MVKQGLGYLLERIGLVLSLSSSEIVESLSGIGAILWSLWVFSHPEASDQIVPWPGLLYGAALWLTLLGTFQVLLALAGGKWIRQGLALLLYGTWFAVGTVCLVTSWACLSPSVMWHLQNALMNLWIYGRLSLRWR